MSKAAEKKPSFQMKRLARLAAVQGLYQLALHPEETKDALIKRFRADPGVLLQEEQTALVDTEMFATIVAGVAENAGSLDEMITGAMDERLSSARLEPLLRAILRAGTYELLHRGQIQPGIIVNDYIDVAHSFFDAKEPGLVNAVLDKLAKNLRS